jgi:hypothetical protein
MRQMSLAQQAEFQWFAKSRREQFLEEMDAVMPWAEFLAMIEPHYPWGEMGRKPVGLGILLRLYFVQHWFALSDPAAEDADRRLQRGSDAWTADTRTVAERNVSCHGTKPYEARTGQVALSASGALS